MLRTELRTLRLRELTQLGPEVGQKNARSMSPATYKRLVENIKHDGVLTSTPLVGRMEGKDDKLFVISGNHRVAAALDAGVQEAVCMVILDPVPRERFSAIQLSHNAIDGEDDASILQELYAILDLDLKSYSGLTDDDFETEDLSVVTLAANAPLYIEIVLGFLADDARAVEAFLKSAARYQRKKTPAFLAPYAESNAIKRSDKRFVVQRLDGYTDGKPSWRKVGRRAYCTRQEATLILVIYTV